MPGRCPELEIQPDLYYNEKESKKYSNNSHIIEIQSKLSERALELCNLPPDSFSLILDIGCGSGLSGEVIEEAGHFWFGVDISIFMLEIAKSRGMVGNLILGDMGNGVPFKPGSFDACISISAIQWLCNSYSSSQIPSKRLYSFFSSLYKCMSFGSRAVFQFYPQSHQQVELINNAALRAGFTGGLVVDYPNSTRAKKLFLCLFVGIQCPSLPKAIDGSSSNFTEKSKKKKKLVKKSKAWIIAKKESQAKKGLEVRPHSKYTGRKRRPKF